MLAGNELEQGAEPEYFAPRGAWDLAGTYDLIYELQPDAVIGNNSHILLGKGEDYQVWELDFAGENTIGFNTTQVGDKPTVCWWKVNAARSYQPRNHSVKSADVLAETYKRARAKNAVFFLNVGPRSFGDIHPEEQQVLRDVKKLIGAGGT